MGKHSRRAMLTPGKGQEENNAVSPPTRFRFLPVGRPLADRGSPSYMSPTAAANNRTAATAAEKSKRRVSDRTPSNATIATPVTPAYKRASFDSSYRRTLHNEFCSEVPLPRNSELMAKSIFKLFEVDTAAQGRWWAITTIVKACHKLANLHPSTPLVEGSFGLEFFVEETVAGICHSSFESEVSKGAGFQDRSKKIYLRSFKSIESFTRVHAIYADFSENVPWLPPMSISSPLQWLKTLESAQYSIKLHVPPMLHALCNWWHSVDAEKLFVPRDGETAHDAACNIQSMLSEAAKSTGLATELIEGLASSDPPTYFITNFDGEPLKMKFDPVQVEKLALAVKTKAAYLLKAVSLMLDVDPENEPVRWGDCCTMALNEIRHATGDDTIRHSTTIGRWLREFRTNRKFSNPLMTERFGIALFNNYPMAAVKIRECGNNNLEQLSLNLMKDYIAHTLVPELAEEHKMPVEKFLAENGLKKICYNTVHRWLKFLGFRRNIYKKGFYTDIHERPDIVKARIEYCIDIFRLERHSRVWVQLTPERVQELKENKKIYPENSGVAVSNGDGKEYFEFHVDDVVHSELLPELDGNPFGGNYSFRLGPDEDRTIEWGQDEVVCSEKAMNSMAWYGTDGKQALRPKDLGMSIMLSGVISRDAGWNPVPSEEQLWQINANRQGKEYVAPESAIAVLGSALKKPLSMEDAKNFVFRWHIIPGANNEGYWTNNHTLVQLENICDVASVMFPGKKHVICYDHSQGHCAKRKDGLDASRLNKEYGGQQPAMHSTKLIVGTRGHHVNDGCRLDFMEEQHCVFQDWEAGPSWMTPEQQAATKHDRTFDDQTITRTLRSKKEIFDHLIKVLGRDTAGLPAAVNHVSLASLRDVAKKHNVSLTVQEVKSQKGWLGAPKGALQLCIERGLVDLSLVKKNKGYYTMDGRKDKEGNPIEGTSLRQLLEECVDFKQEVSMLEWVANRYGWRVIFSPKCHPEIAGVGIEYVWSVAKNCLARIPLKDRKGKDKFTEKVVNHCFDNSILTLPAVRGSARKRRQYLTAYLLLHALEAAKQQAASNGEDKGQPLLEGEVSVDKIQEGTELKQRTIMAARKMYKRHRGIALFNHDDNKISFQSMESVEEWMAKHQPKK